jgi:hypothetical protein
MIGTDLATFTEGVAMHNDLNGDAGGLQAAALGCRSTAANSAGSPWPQATV